ncbi:putative SCO1/SenC family protein (copper-binding protein) [marine gamma proteobacterium HTCC2143]|jgi:protein SCO1/2|uniref:Putative SCO1/SenC family protein (Copper-binding protein) n=1 Tax=marine gamma proteobacterium HTCC2143 TaxID=247633 RepID=A0YDD0_9GAMM|nr:putative SCO1/SenC family protein (copper-binding protein) [marine gamma proteobacterium HTCC2143]
MGHRNRTLFLLLTAVFFVSVIAVFTVALYLNNSPPLIKGVIIPKSQTISNFSLLTHKNEPFTNESLLGDWHILAYGYTDCPDICPTTLAALVDVERNIIDSGQYTNVNILFYTVDPQRDTVEKLATYIPFFSRSFIGLTVAENTSEHLSFEKSLGLQALLTPLPDDAIGYKRYSVSHGVMLYIMNASGELQAILKPDINAQGTQSFSSDDIYRDYLALRKYFAVNS